MKLVMSEEVKICRFCNIWEEWGNKGGICIGICCKPDSDHYLHVLNENHPACSVYLDVDDVEEITQDKEKEK